MAMRPHPEPSTDILYSPFPVEDLVEVGNAIGFNDLRYVTTATLRPDRVLYHACLNGVQTYVKLDHLDEQGRAQEIADRAGEMYAELKTEFLAQLPGAQARLDAQQAETDYFCGMVHALEGKKPWKPAPFHTSWPTDRFPHRWQKKAIETYAAIRGRIASGEFTPREGDDAGTLTAYWSKRNLEYKYYRDIARGLVDNYLTETLDASEFLTMHPTDQRVVTMFIGGMGSGKTVLTNAYLEGLSPEQRQDMILHNADYLKKAVFDSAKADGILPPDFVYTGNEVQYESSNALYESALKRGYLARNRFRAPNVVLNSIAFGTFELGEAIAGGGHVIAHHIFMEPEEAYKDGLARASKGDGRLPLKSDFEWSAAASARSLLLLAQEEYHPANIRAHLYRREAGQGHEHYATIDAETMEVYIHHMGALAGMCAHIHRDHEAGDAVRLFLQAFRAAGYGITLTQERDRHHPVATLDPEGRLRICDETAFAALHFGRGMLQSLAAGELAQLAPDACPIPYLREAITPGQQPSRIR